MQLRILVRCVEPPSGCANHVIVVTVVVQSSGSDAGGRTQIFVVTITPRLGTGAPVTATVEGRCGMLLTPVLQRAVPCMQRCTVGGV